MADTRVTKRRPLASGAASSDIFSHPIVSTGAPPALRISLMMARTRLQSSGGENVVVVGGGGDASGFTFEEVWGVTAGPLLAPRLCILDVGNGDAFRSCGAAAADAAAALPPPRGRFVAVLAWLLAMLTCSFFFSDLTTIFSASISILMCPRLVVRFDVAAAAPSGSPSFVWGVEALTTEVDVLTVALVSLVPFTPEFETTR